MSADRVDTELYWYVLSEGRASRWGDLNTGARNRCASSRSAHSRSKSDDLRRRIVEMGRDERHACLRLPDAQRGPVTRWNVHLRGIDWGVLKSDGPIRGTVIIPTSGHGEVTECRAPSDSGARHHGIAPMETQRDASRGTRRDINGRLMTEDVYGSRPSDAVPSIV